MSVVRWVLIAVCALWPVVSFAGGLGFSPLVALAALVMIPFTLRGWTPRLYMAFLLAGIGFAAASALWAQRDLVVLGVDDRSGVPKISLDAVRVGLTLAWCGWLMHGAGKLSPQAARWVLRVAAVGLGLQLLIVVVLTVFETQAIALFSGMMTNAGEGVQNISRNQLILSVMTPLLAVLMVRILPGGAGLIAAAGVILVAVTTMILRGVDGAVLAVAAGCVAAGLILLTPRSGFKLMATLTAVALALTPFVFGALTQGADASLATSSSEWRLAIWKRVGEVVEQNWIWGAGVGSLRTITEIIPAGVFAGEKLVPNHPHNMFLQLWAEVGAIGVVLVMAAIVAAGARMPEPRKLGGVGSLAAGLAGATLVISVVSFDLWNDWWWAVCGLAATLLVVLRRADGESPLPLLARWAPLPSAEPK